jgi:hypothetical protein
MPRNQNSGCSNVHQWYSVVVGELKTPFARPSVGMIAMRFMIFTKMPFRSFLSPTFFLFAFEGKELFIVRLEPLRVLGTLAH